MKKILDIGNCGPDHSSFVRLVREYFDGSVTPVDNLEQAIEALATDSYHLITVNRILDRCGSEGLTVIKAIKANTEFNDIPVMMVTNYADHQEIARGAGAVPGFGKSSLNSPDTVEMLRKYLA